jgi:outer membrane lipoprotein carrier protein
MFLKFAAGVLALGAAAPASVDVRSIREKLESRYRSARTLQATFLERYSESDQLTREEAGVAYFQRPGKMRWEYESPEKNVFLVDGKMAWFYVPADHTVTRAPAKQSSDWRTPLALLAGEMKLSRVCASVRATASESPITAGDVVLDCVERGADRQNGNGASDSGTLQDPNSEDTVALEVAPASGELVRVLVRERGGISIDFRFANWRFDPPVAASLFRFDVPRGVAIVNGESSEPRQK